MPDTTEASVGATRSPRPDLFSAAAPLHDIDRLGDDHTVQIVAVGEPNRRALNTHLLTAIGRAAIEHDRAEGLLSILASKHIGTLLSKADADVRPLITHCPTVTEEISA